MTFVVGALVGFTVPKLSVNEPWYFLNDMVGKIVANNYDGTYRVSVGKQMYNVRAEVIYVASDEARTPITWKQMEGIWVPKEKA